jgi:hypothetical protein
VSGRAALRRLQDANVRRIVYYRRLRWTGHVAGVHVTGFGVRRVAKCRRQTELIAE